MRASIGEGAVERIWGDIARGETIGEMRIPSLKSMRFHVSTLYSASRHDESARLTDLLIRPDLSSVSMLDWSALERAAEIGYKHTLRALAQADAPWQANLASKRAATSRFVQEAKMPQDLALVA